MAYEVINRLRGFSTVRAVDAGTYTVELADLQANSQLETVTSAIITDVSWSTTGSISIARNTTPILNLSGSHRMSDAEGILPAAGANSSTSNVKITIVGGGCIILNLKKQASMNADNNKGLFTN